MSEIIWEAMRDSGLEEAYYRCKHPSGLEIQVCTKPGYSSAYALFSTKYGSIDTSIVCEDGSVTEIPEGTAHFLEHKLFESEDLDAFARFAKTGASANAFTSFENTSYEFSCSGSFGENLEILLDFVQSPYFTEATVQKEQGIIGQEIRMYQDYPGWVEMMGLLQTLYHSHPVRCDIAGTEQSIAEITAQLLHGCYRNFYNLHNMILTVVGSATKEQVLAVADKLLKPCQGSMAVRKRRDDGAPPAQKIVRRRMAVTVPTFLLGCKERMDWRVMPMEELVAAQLALDALAGEDSALYGQLLEEGFVNTKFSSELFTGDDFCSVLLGGESHCPEKAAEKITAALTAAAREGLDPADIERARKKAWGRMVMGFNDIEDLARRMTEDWFAGGGLFGRAQVLRAITPADVNRRLARMFRPDYFALSIIEPIEEG